MTRIVNNCVALVCLCLFWGQSLRAADASHSEQIKWGNVKSAKRKNRFSKTKLKSQIGKTPKRKRPVSRHTHKNGTAFERLSNGIQTLFFMQKKTLKSIVNSAKIRIFT